MYDLIWFGAEGNLIMRRFIVGLFLQYLVMKTEF